MDHSCRIGQANPLTPNTPPMFATLDGKERGELRFETNLYLGGTF